MSPVHDQAGTNDSHTPNVVAMEDIDFTQTLERSATTLWRDATVHMDLDNPWGSPEHLNMDIDPTNTIVSVVIYQP